MHDVVQDLGPDQNVEGYSMAAWQALLNASLAGWQAPALAAGVWETYYNDSTINPQRAYDDFNTDYGLTCANARIAVGAKVGGYSSPIYLFFNNWPPSQPIVVSPTFNITWAYHTWDYNAALENWVADQPAASDTALSVLLQTLWYDFMADGALDPATGWRSVEDVPGFPYAYGTFVMATPTRPPYTSSSFIVNYKSDTCALLASYGFDARFWWCD